MTNITNAMLNHYNQLAARAEAETLQDCIARAEAAEAELERLRAALRIAEPYLYNTPLTGAIDAWQVVSEALYGKE